MMLGCIMLVLLGTATEVRCAYRMTTASSNDASQPASNAIDGNRTTIYSSSSFPTGYNDRGTYLAAWMASAAPVNQVLLTAAVSASHVQCFPASYTIRVTDRCAAGTCGGKGIDS